MFWLVAALFCFSCAARDLSAPEPEQSKTVIAKIPVVQPRAIDILFVIDDSASMAQEQQALADNFAAFMEVLRGIEGGLPSVHIGVVSSNVGTGPDGGGGPACAGYGDNGVLQVPEHCAPLTDGLRFIRDIPIGPHTSERAVNYTGLLEEQFACMAQLGTGGCGFEQHLEAMRRALSNDTGNGGFVRDDAFLAVIFVQDEDDCSASDPSLFDPTQDDRDAPLGELSSFRCFEFGTVCDQPDDRMSGEKSGCQADSDSAYLEPVARYVQFLKQLKGDPSKVIVAAVSGDRAPVVVSIEDQDRLQLAPVCVVCPDGTSQGCSLDANQPNSALVAAAPAIRMRSFLDAFPQRNTWQNICTYANGQIDFSGALTQIAYGITVPLGPPCIEGCLAEPVQCSVTDVRNHNQPNHEEFPLPACDGASPPCWRLVADASCDTATGLALEIDRGSQQPPADTTVVAHCAID